jgi:hypothetical protein
VIPSRLTATLPRYSAAGPALQLHGAPRPQAPGVAPPPGRCCSCNRARNSKLMGGLEARTGVLERSTLRGRRNGAVPTGRHAAQVPPEGIGACASRAAWAATLTHAGGHADRPPEGVGSPPGGLRRQWGAPERTRTCPWATAPCRRSGTHHGTPRLSPDPARSGSTSRSRRPVCHRPPTVLSTPE